MGLNTSWSKTKIQNLGHGVTPAPVQLQGHIVESIDRFTYLGSDIYSSERSTPEILRHIGLASNIFGRLANTWKRTGLSLQAKIRLYNALVISVLLYGLETWTLLKADERRLEAFHMNFQRRILGIHWFHFVTNASVTSQTGEEDLAIRICRRRLCIFGHVRRLPEATPAHSELRLAVDTLAGGKPDIRPEWKRQRGRPCRTWVQQIEDDTGLNANDAWRIAHDRKSWRALRVRPVAGQAFH